jgi:hypothetical protein
LEPIIDGPQYLEGDVNCDGKTPCFTNLERDFSCGPPPACNQPCGTNFDCEGALNGCTQCRPNPEGQTVCQPPPPACDAACASDRDCFGGLNGCTACVAGQCRVPPACGVSCSRDDQCAGAVKDGCSVCAPGANGVKVCQEPFDDGACKCDGFNALNLQNPANSNFQFEAFAKVEGANVNKAGVKSIQFQMTKSTKSNPNAGTVIASSDLLTPQIVSSTTDKVRYKSTWSVTPPAYDPNGVYRVFANIKCDRKFATVKKAKVILACKKGMD